MRAHFNQVIVIDGHRYEIGYNEVINDHIEHWYFKASTRAGYIVFDENVTGPDDEPEQAKKKEPKKKLTKKKGR